MSARTRVDAVLVDLPDANDAESWRQPAAALVVVDDRNRFAAHADAIVQPSLPEWSGPGSADRVESGYAWIPLSRAYTRLANVAAGVSPAGPREIFLCLGGSDPGLVTERLVRSVPDRAVPALSVVVGAGYRGRTDGWPVEPAVDPPDLPDRLGRATVAILGGGTMKFEAACLGVPAVLVAAADDQLPVGPPFAATGAAAWAGDGRRVDPALVWTVALRLLDDASERDAMARRGREVVDGLGAGRIAELVLATIAERRAG